MGDAGTAFPGGELAGGAFPGGSRVTSGDSNLIPSQSGFCGSFRTADPRLGAPASNGGPIRAWLGTTLVTRVFVD